MAVERYHTNANNVKAMNQFGQSTPLSGMMGVGQMKPVTPADTMYAIVFALVFGVAGAVLLIKGKEL